MQRTLVVLIAIAAFGATAMLVILVTRPDPPVLEGGGEPAEVRYPAPQFTLTDHHGNPFGGKDLEGKVYVVDFIFTRCGSICPSMTQSMREVHAKLKQRDDWADIRLLSISVDPEYDTVDVLAGYVEGFQIDDTQWHFLTGEREAIWKLIQEGFKQSVGEDALNTAMPIYHTPNFLLIDCTGQVRGVYQGIDTPQQTNEVEQLLQDLDRVMKEEP